MADLAEMILAQASGSPMMNDTIQNFSKNRVLAAQATDLAQQMEQRKALNEIRGKAYNAMEDPILGLGAYDPQALYAIAGYKKATNPMGLGGMGNMKMPKNLEEIRIMKAMAEAQGNTEIVDALSSVEQQLSGGAEGGTGSSYNKIFNAPTSSTNKLMEVDTKIAENSSSARNAVGEMDMALRESLNSPDSTFGIFSPVAATLNSVFSEMGIKTPEIDYANMNQATLKKALTGFGYAKAPALGLAPYSNLDIQGIMQSVPLMTDTKDAARMAMVTQKVYAQRLANYADYKAEFDSSLKDRDDVNLANYRSQLDRFIADKQKNDNLLSPSQFMNNGVPLLLSNFLSEEDVEKKKMFMNDIISNVKDGTPYFVKTENGAKKLRMNQAVRQTLQDKYNKEFGEEQNVDTQMFGSEVTDGNQ